MKIALALAALVLLAFYLFSTLKNKENAAKNIEKTISYGPFTIHVRASTGKGFNINYGITTYTNVAYSISHAGKPVTFPGALQNNTGLPFLWKVYARPGAPDPTLIAGSQSLYLIYLKNGAPVVEPLLEQGYDFASLQFLDSENGQPGAYSEVFSKNEATDLEKLDSLEGGRFLMVSEHAILEVQTGKIWQFNVSNEAVENYSFPAPHGALAFSPDQKSIVFRAQFQAWNTPDEDLPDSEHALVVFDFEKNKGYAVRFDDTDTRLTDIQNAGFQWFERYFEWQKTPDGYQLQLRKLEKLPNWTGRYNPQDNYYTLFPVKPGMLPVFLDYVLNQMGWSKTNIVKDETHEYTGRCLDLVSGKIKLDIVFKEDEQILTFSKNLYTDDSPEYQALVKKIAGAFDAELASGKHQEHFGRILSETKRIRGL